MPLHLELHICFPVGQRLRSRRLTRKRQRLPLQQPSHKNKYNDDYDYNDYDIKTTKKTTTPRTTLIRPGDDHDYNEHDRNYHTTTTTTATMTTRQRLRRPSHKNDYENSHATTTTTTTTTNITTSIIRPRIRQLSYNKITTATSTTTTTTRRAHYHRTPLRANTTTITTTTATTLVRPRLRPPQLRQPWQQVAPTIYSTITSRSSKQILSEQSFDEVHSVRGPPTTCCPSPSVSWLLPRWIPLPPLPPTPELPPWVEALTRWAQVTPSRCKGCRSFGFVSFNVIGSEC